ncbi:MAG: class I SAM-dependent methyltransferase, partial [Methanobrevibacter sp.]|nr:class I SAM-dependent methyltransferase [Methanobrevibacter sp.]
MYINLKNNGIFDIFTHLTNMEKITLYKTAAKTEKAVVVEIGSYLGASSCFLAAGLKGGVIYCIDTWKNDTMSNDQEDTYPAFKENTKKYIDKIIPIRGWSHEVIDEFSEKIDKN